MSRLRVGIVGAGIADHHLGAFDALPDLFEVKVVCSLDRERGEPMAARHGVPVFTESFDELLGREDIDLVDICTPPHSHFALSEQALRAGKHVICEKPLFGSIADVDQMAEIVAETGRVLMPIFQYRFGGGMQKLKHLMALGLTGEPFLSTIETHWWRGADYYAVPWRGKWKTELGGGLLGHAIHAHDLLNYVQGASAEVFAFGKTLVNPIEVEDTAVLSLRMTNGSLASLSMTLGARDEMSRIRFCFRDLTAESNRQAYRVARDPWVFTAGDEAHQRRVDEALAGYAEQSDGYQRQFELLHAALTGGGELPVTLRDARNSLELVTAAYHSQRTGQAVSLPLTASHPLYRSWLPPEVQTAP